MRNIECMQRALLSVKVCTTNRVLSGELQVATAKRNASASVKNVIFRIKQANDSAGMNVWLVLNVF